MREFDITIEPDKPATTNVQSLPWDQNMMFLGDDGSVYLRVTDNIVRLHGPHVGWVYPVDNTSVRVQRVIGRLNIKGI